MYFSFVEKQFLIYTSAKNLKHKDLELRIVWFNDTLNYISNPIIKGEQVKITKNHLHERCQMPNKFGISNRNIPTIALYR